MQCHTLQRFTRLYASNDDMYAGSMKNHLRVRFEGLEVIHQQETT